MRGVRKYRALIALISAAVLSAQPTFAADGLSRNMHAAEAAVGREEYELAAQYFEAECNAGGARGCFELALFEHVGKFAASNPAKSMALNKRACDLGLADGCANLAVQTLEEKSGDRAEPTRLAERACNRESATGCFTMALIYEGKYGGVVRRGKAARMLEKACQLGHGEACYRHGLEIAKTAIDDRDWQRVANLYLAACDTGAAAGCNGLGALAAEGRGGPPDGAVARTYFELGCDRGDENACRNLGRLLIEGKLIQSDALAGGKALQRAELLARPTPVLMDVP